MPVIAYYSSNGRVLQRIGRFPYYISRGTVADSEEDEDDEDDEEEEPDFGNEDITFDDETVTFGDT